MSAGTFVQAVMFAVIGIHRAAAGTDAHRALEYRDDELGVVVTLPAGWQANRLPAHDGTGRRVGFASAETARNAAAKSQTLDNPRYQDVLLDLLPRDAIDDVAARRCRSGVARRRTAGGTTAIVCDATSALGGDVQLLVATREAFLQTPRGILHFVAEAKGESQTPRPDLLDLVLDGTRLLTTQR
jgi:hypothetical protein